MARQLKLSPGEFLSWVAANYSEAFREECATLVEQAGESYDPDLILDQVILKHEPQVKYNGKKFGSMRTNSH